MKEEEEEGGEFAEWGKAGFDVLPSCKMKPVDSQQPSDLDFGDSLVRLRQNSRSVIFLKKKKKKKATERVHE